jgi:transposase
MIDRKGVFVSKNDQFTCGVISNFIAGKVTLKEAAQLLDVTESTVSRKARKFEEKGIFSLQHGNKGKRPKNKSSELLKLQVLKLVREKIFDFNADHLKE